MLRHSLIESDRFLEVLTFWQTIRRSKPEENHLHFFPFAVVEKWHDPTFRNPLYVERLLPQLRWVWKSACIQISRVACLIHLMWREMWSFTVTSNTWDSNSKLRTPTPIAVRVPARILKAISTNAFAPVSDINSQVWSQSLLTQSV
jgi:hypothetical protein